MKNNARSSKIIVSADGRGLVSQAGSLRRMPLSAQPGRADGPFGIKKCES